jgi:hypothetical protein
VRPNPQLLTNVLKNKKKVLWIQIRCDWDYFAGNGSKSAFSACQSGSVSSESLSNFFPENCKNIQIYDTYSMKLTRDKTSTAVS